MSSLEANYATTEDLAYLYRIKRITVQRRAADGTWPSSKIGNRYRFSPEQQEEIKQIVLGTRDNGLDKNRIAAALRNFA